MTGPKVPVRTGPARARPKVGQGVAVVPLPDSVPHRLAPVTLWRDSWRGGATVCLLAVLPMLSALPGWADDLIWTEGDPAPGPLVTPVSGDWSAISGRLSWSNTDGSGPAAFENGDTISLANDGGGGRVTLRLSDSVRVSALSFLRGDMAVTTAGIARLTGLAGADLTVESGAVAALEAPVTGDFDLVVGGTFTLTTTGSGISSITVLGSGDLTVATPAGVPLVVAGGAVNDGRMTLTDGSRLQAQVTNGGTLNLLGEVAINGALRNAPGGLVRLSGVTRLGDGSASAVLNESRFASIAAGAGADVTVAGTFENTATGFLDGVGQPLRLRADRIVLRFGHRIGGDVQMIAGSVLNEGLLDLAAMPVLGGAVENGATGTLIAAGTVDGAGHDLTSAGTLTVAGTGALNGLGTLTNRGTLRVETGGQVSAVRLWHQGGTLTSRGTLTGQLDLDADADLAGRVAGAVQVGAGITRATGTLEVTGGGAGPDLRVAAPARFEIAAGQTVTAPQAEVAGTLSFGGSGATLAGGMTASGTLEGQGRVTGALTLTGAAQVAADADITVADRVITATTAPTLWSGLGGLTTRALENRGLLTLDRGFAGSVRNTARGTLGITADLGGPLLSQGTTRLGATGAGPVTLGGPVTIGAGTTSVLGTVRATGPDALRIEAPGTLRLSTGDLTAEAGVEAQGSLIVESTQVLTTPRLTVGGAVSGTAGLTTVAGRVAGQTEVRSDGQLQLDGGEITGPLSNAGTLTSTASPGRGPITLGAGLVNTGTATLGLAGHAARVTGDIANTGTADVTAEVTGRLINDGTLTAAGRAQALDNRRTATVAAGGRLVLDSGAANAAGARLTVAGQLDGRIDNAAGAVTTVQSTGRVTGPMTNDGTLTLSGQADGVIDNRAGGQLRITGTAAVAERGIDNRAGATVTMAAGSRLDGDLRNAAGATLTGAGTIDGNLTNEGTIRLSGDMAVTGRLRQFGSILNGGSGLLTLMAETIEIAGTSTVGEGVKLMGDTLLSGHITYDSDSVLHGDLDLAAGSSLTVAAELDGQGTANLDNAGTVRVSGDGGMIRMQQMANRNVIINAGTLAGNRLDNKAGAILRNSGMIRADVTNERGGTLQSTGAIVGTLANQGAAQMAGAQVTGRLANQGRLTVTGALQVSGDLVNSGIAQIAAGTTRTDDLRNTGTLNVETGAALAAERGVVSTGTLTVDGTLSGRLTNSGTATLNTQLRGDAVNTDSGVLTLAQGATGGLVNSGQQARVAGAFGGGISNAASSSLITTGDLTATGLTSAGSLRLVTGTTTSLRDGLDTRAGSATVIAENATLQGDLRNSGSTGLGGTVTGNVTNRAGLLSTAVINTGEGALISGVLTNGAPPLAAIDVLPGTVPDPAEGASVVRVRADDRLTVTGGTLNAAGSRITVEGTMASAIQNFGTLTVSGQVQGDVTTTGRLTLVGGQIGGHLRYGGGALSMTDGGRVGKTLSLLSDLAVGGDQTITAGRIEMAAGKTLRVTGGDVVGDVVNKAGRVVLADEARLADGLRNDAGGTVEAAGVNDIGGTLVNQGTVNLQNGQVGDRLRLGNGLSGNGVYALDLDLNNRDGGYGGDRIEVLRGEVSGHIRLDFEITDRPAGSVTGKPITILEMSGTKTPPTYTYEAEGLPAANEKIVYALVRDEDTGNLDLTYRTNASISGLSGNIVLTQSLIGSVVNRPTSPFVTGYALAEGEAPCAPGAWARMTGGRADATGSSATSGADAYRVSSAISARYSGLQFGGDLACFDGHFNGWNMAFGVIGGVNDGSTRQPVYLLDNVNGTWRQSGTLGSINTADFRQIYGGAYLTATRDRLSADLQLRREKTEFTLNNTPVLAGSDGLGITDAVFDSHAVTLSGSLSYAFPLGDKGWQMVPTAGFALSRITTDPIVFDQGERLEIRDTTSRVGFVGATLSRGQVLASGTEAVNYYATGTIYHDFAGGTQSDFIMSETEGSAPLRERLTSDNLGTYGEIGIGASYTRVLQPGGAGKPRQISGSVRLDGRSGASLDSYGITAQLRLQF